MCKYCLLALSLESEHYIIKKTYNNLNMKIITAAYFVTHFTSTCHHVPVQISVLQSRQQSFCNSHTTPPPKTKYLGELTGMNGGSGVLPGLTGVSGALPGLNEKLGALPGLNGIRSTSWAKRGIRIPLLA